MSGDTLAPPLADAAAEHVVALMRMTRMRTPAVVADVLPTAKAPRGDPTEVVRVLLGAVATGRNRSMPVTRRERAGCPTGKNFDLCDEALVHPSSVDNVVPAEPGVGAAGTCPAHIGDLIRRLPALFDGAWLITVPFRSDLYPDWYRPCAVLTISAK